MALLSRLFSGRKKSSSKSSSAYGSVPEFNPWQPVPLDVDQVTVLVFRECEQRGRRLLFDSSAVRLVTGAAQHQGLVEVENDTGFKYLRQRSDAKQLGEMVFGAVAMAYAGPTCKVHLVRGADGSDQATAAPDTLMFSRVFPIPRSTARRVRTHGSSGTSLEDSCSSTGSELSLLRLDTGVPSPQHTRSSSVDCPPPGGRLSEDSGLSSIDSFMAPPSCLPTPYGTPISAQGSGASLGSHGSLHRHSLLRPHGSADLAPMTSRDDVTLRATSRTRLAVSVLVALDGPAPSVLEDTLLLYSVQLEHLLARLQLSVERPYMNRRHFVRTVYQSSGAARQDLLNLLTCPRLPRPVWLGLTSPSVTSHQRQRLAELFVAELTSLIGELDTKECNCFVTTVLTAVLTHHLNWVTTVAARCGGGGGGGRLDGAAGHPARPARTLVVGRRSELVRRLLLVLSYFVRGRLVTETMPWSFSPLRATNNNNTQLTPVETVGKQPVSQPRADEGGGGTTSDTPRPTAGQREALAGTVRPGLRLPETGRPVLETGRPPMFDSERSTLSETRRSSLTENGHVCLVGAAHTLPENVVAPLPETGHVPAPADTVPESVGSRSRFYVRLDGSCREATLPGNSRFYRPLSGAVADTCRCGADMCQGVTDTCRDVTDACRGGTDTCRDVADTCQGVADTCRGGTDTCRDVAGTCRGGTDTCRDVAGTCRGGTDTCRRWADTCRRGADTYRGMIDTCRGGADTCRRGDGDVHARVAGADRHHHRDRRAPQQDGGASRASLEGDPVAVRAESCGADSVDGCGERPAELCSDAGGSGGWMARPRLTVTPASEQAARSPHSPPDADLDTRHGCEAGVGPACSDDSVFGLDPDPDTGRGHSSGPGRGRRSSPDPGSDSKNCIGADLGSGARLVPGPDPGPGPGPGSGPGLGRGPSLGPSSGPGSSCGRSRAAGLLLAPSPSALCHSRSCHDLSVADGATASAGATAAALSSRRRSRSSTDLDVPVRFLLGAEDELAEDEPPSERGGTRRRSDAEPTVKSSSCGSDDDSGLAGCERCAGVILLESSGVTDSTPVTSSGSQLSRRHSDSIRDTSHYLRGYRSFRFSQPSMGRVRKWRHLSDGTPPSPPPFVSPSPTVNTGEPPATPVKRRLCRCRDGRLRRRVPLLDAGRGGPGRQCLAPWAALGGGGATYVPDMPLWGCDSRQEWEPRLRHDLQAATCAGEECTCVVADTDSHSVEVLSSHAFPVDRPGALGLSVVFSPLVSTLVESVCRVHQSGAPAPLVVLHLERQLATVVARAAEMAQFLINSSLTNLREVTELLDVDSNDIPLLLSAASVLCPDVTNKYGLSVR